MRGAPVTNAAWRAYRALIRRQIGRGGFTPGSGAPAGRLPEPLEALARLEAPLLLLLSGAAAVQLTHGSLTSSQRHPPGAADAPDVADSSDKEPDSDSDSESIEEPESEPEEKLPVRSHRFETPAFQPTPFAVSLRFQHQLNLHCKAGRGVPTAPAPAPPSYASYASLLR